VRLLRSLCAELIAEISSPEEYADVSERWLADTLTEIFPALYEGLRKHPVVRDKPRPKQDIDLPWGPPGHVLGTLTKSQKHPAFRGRETLYSEQSWQKLLSGLASQPMAVRLVLNQLDKRGFPVHNGYASIQVVRDADHPEWVSFSFVADASDTGWPDSADTQNAWAGFVKRQAMGMRAAGGFVTDDAGPRQTSLQRAIMDSSAGISDSREVLRGYSWITVVAPDIASRLGGDSALRATGAFYDVSLLPNGAVWLRATPTINEFTGEKIRAVFEALAPALPSGVARFRFPTEEYRLVEGADAADFR
jgi:hypothetical protein